MDRVGVSDSMRSMSTFKYHRSDFKPLPVKLEHMDLAFSFFEDRVEVSNTLRITARDRLDKVRLDARELEIRRVERVSPSGPEAADFEFDRENAALFVALPRAVAAGETFTIRTDTVCIPSENILEGIYRDTAPRGRLPQFMSQCQQWGFQRVAPVFDDCTAKCTMSTVIEADARYTHLISNGDIDRAANPDGLSVPKAGDPSRKVIRYVNRIPMAPYLFIVCVGTWDMLVDEAVYPSGRKVRLEYLVPPGQKAGAVVPMKILKDSVLWQGRTQEYEYAREAYRTICMEKSNFGGMENVGNTTIVTSAALVDEYTSDARLHYAYAVIVHEFEHNQCGSDVTMLTPFDMWLNEAFTVHVERKYLRSVFDPDSVRLDEVASMRSPIGGPLAIEDGGHMGNIVRDGFNDPDELVDGLTYVKAAEVVRMLELVLGEETFRKGKNLYFSRYSGGNADTDCFFSCFEEVSGRELSQFKKEWLYTIGYPKVEARWDYRESDNTLLISLRQTRAGKGGLFHVPISIAAVDDKGRDIAGTALVAEAGTDGSDSMKLEFPRMTRPAFVSFNRDCSFYGVFEDVSSTPEQLFSQIRLDPNRFNRVEAMRRLTDVERIRLIRDSGAKIGEAWLDVFGLLLGDSSLPPGLKAHLLTIEEQSLNRDMLPRYRERYAARLKLMQAVAQRWYGELLEAFHGVDTYAPAKEPRDGIEERQLKAVLLRLLVESGKPETQELAEAHFRKAWNITDRMSAVGCINLSDHPRRRAILEEAFGAWKDHHAAYTAYLTILGSGRHGDIFEMIEAEERKPVFRLEHPSHSRALYLPVGSNNGVVWTDRGIRWMTDTVISLAKVNENTANRLLQTFQLVHRLADDLKPKVLKALGEIRAGVDKKHSPSVAGRVEAYLG